jgi:hypothetical protein
VRRSTSASLTQNAGDAIRKGRKLSTHAASVGSFAKFSCRAVSGAVISVREKQRESCTARLAKRPGNAPPVF